MIVFEHTTGAALIWLGVAAALIAGAFSVWRFAPRNLATAVISGCYLVFTLLLAWCLFLPGRRTVRTETLKPRFIVALDTSRSMLLSPADDISNRWTVARQALSHATTAR